MSEIPDFDPNFPCSYCEQPVVELSVGGSAVCPWCDCGMFREGGLWDYKTMQDRFANFRRRMAGSVAFSHPYHWPSEFVDWFCKGHIGCFPERDVTRIEFERINVPVGEVKYP